MRSVIQASLPRIAAAALLAAPLAVRAEARIVIVNLNAPGEGFNDPTPAAPLPTNPGATVGEQRILAFEHAAAIWGSTLDSASEIRIGASFEARPCTATSAVLGSAGTTSVFGFDPGTPGVPFPDTWYHVALANKLVSSARSPVDLVADVPGSFHIRARFNKDLGNPSCLAGSGWYYGLDTATPPNLINLVTVLLHEFAHGLGFSSFANVSSGAFFFDLVDVYSKFYRDLTTGKTREEMTDAERAASAVNPRNVVWTGPHVTEAVPAVLASGTPLLQVTAPAAIAGRYQVGPAAFGPPLGTPGVSGTVVLGLDGVGTATDACTPLVNGAEVAGKIALVDRGTCTFVTKVRNAQDAGALAVIVADNVAGSPPSGLGGVNPTIVIPSVRITLDDGVAIKAQLAAGVQATLGVDLAVRAGADPGGRALLYTPNPVQPGSTVSHWDTLATPNQLMEPAINSDLTHSVDVPEDLTYAQLWDVGWFPDRDLDSVADDGTDQCPGSDLRATVVVGDEDTGVPNLLFANGCTISDLVSRCARDARNHGGFVSCVAHLGNGLLGAGFISEPQKGALQRAAAHAK